MGYDSKQISNFPFLMFLMIDNAKNVQGMVPNHWEDQSHNDFKIKSEIQKLVFKNGQVGLKSRSINSVDFRGSGLGIDLC